MATQLVASSSEYFEVDTIPDVVAPPISVCAWVYSDSNPTSNDFCAFQMGDKDVSNKYFRLGYDDVTTDGAARWTANDGTSRFCISSAVAPQNEWHHLLGVEAASNDRRVYLNGGSKGTDTNSSTPNNIDRTSIGREGDSTPGDYWNGRLAEVAVWSAALTDDEARMLAAGVSPVRVRPGSLKHYWPFWIGTSGIDHIGTLNLTAVNTPTQADHAPVQPPFGFGLGWQGALTAAVGGGSARRRVGIGAGQAMRR